MILFQVDDDDSNCTENYIEVRDGRYETDDVIGRHCGGVLPRHYRSEGQYFHVRLVTQGNGKDAEFSLKLRMRE